MAKFIISFQKTVTNEGGYINDPDDLGGETYKGIARNSHNSWDGWQMIDSQKGKPDFPQSLDCDQKLQSLVVNELLSTVRNKSIATCSLIATELGKPVYVKAGYRTVASYSFMEREKPWMPALISENIIPFEEKYRTMVYRLDRQVSGENREVLLNDYLSNTILYVENNKLTGFYVPDLKEGFIFADTTEAGLALMQLKYAMIDKAVLPTENIAGVEFLKKNGFVERRTMTRMILGDDIPWQPEKIFSRIGGNLG